MTTTFAPIATTGATPQRLALLVAPIGPLAIAALRGLLPYDTVDDGTAVVGQVTAHPAAESAVLWLCWLAMLSLPLGVLVVSGVAVRARPVFGSIGAVVAWVGFGSLPFLVTPDQAALAGVDAGLPTATTAALLSALNAHPVASAATTVFVVCHILGAVLLGLALWRAVPRWAALALIVSQPLHFVVAVVMPNHVLDALAWVLTAIGFAAAAAAGRRAATS
jgi:hypothetical protein